MQSLTLLVVAGLFGGMSFFSFGFAPVLFRQLPVTQVRPLLRGTFPYYYLVVIAFSGLAAVGALFVNQSAAIMLVIIFATTVYAKQSLMPKINAASDSDNRSLFKKLHGLSVAIQIAQIGLCGWALVSIA